MWSKTIQTSQRGVDRTPRPVRRRARALDTNSAHPIAPTVRGVRTHDECVVAEGAGQQMIVVEIGIARIESRADGARAELRDMGSV